MKRTMVIIIALTVALSLLALSCAAPAPPPAPPPEEVAPPAPPAPTELPERTIKIGVISALTGGAAPWGMAFRNPVQLYADRWNNAGGLEVGGERVFFEVITENSKYVASEAVAAANKLIFVDNVDYMYVFAATSTLAVRPIANFNKVMLFSGGWGRFLSAEYPYLFRIIPDEMGSAFALFSYIDKNYPEIETMAIINPDNDMGSETDIADAKIWEALGHTVVHRVIYEIGTIDFFPMMTGLMAKNPDIINFSGALASDVPLMAEAARDLGYTEIFASATGGVDIEGLLTQGVVTGVPEEAPLQRAFREEYLARWGELHPWWDFYANGSYPFFYNFMQDADSADPDVVYQTITAPGYTFDTWWGPAYWFGKDVWGIDRNVAAPIPLQQFINGEWIQVGYAAFEDIEPLYATVEIEE